MVEFKRAYEFTNDWASYKAEAETRETHTGYGNDTALEVMLENDKGLYMEPLRFDLRYTGIGTPDEVDEFVREQLAKRFAARF